MPMRCFSRPVPVLLLLPALLTRPAPAHGCPPSPTASPLASPTAARSGLGLLSRVSAAPPPSLEHPGPSPSARKPLASRQEKLAFAGGVALLLVTDRSTLRWFDSDLFEDEARRGDLPRKTSDLASGLPLLAELVIPYLVDGRYGRQSAKLALGATLNALVVVEPLKVAFGRERPDEALGGTVFHGPSTRHDSFPSAHTAIAFAIATVYGHRYRRWRIPIYLLATGVGLSRIDAGRHYLSDVFAGAGIGILAGRASLRGGGRLISWQF
jgi:membrane-associated phospholipid phosphatase